MVCSSFMTNWKLSESKALLIQAPDDNTPTIATRQIHAGRSCKKQHDLCDTKKAISLEISLKSASSVYDGCKHSGAYLF